MPENKTSIENKDTKSPMPQFLLWTFLSLLVTVAAMYGFKIYYNLSGDEVGSLGSLGGAFQGTLGVAAAVAGAIVTIRLAKIAIDQAKKTNGIAERQAQNEDVDFLLARETKEAINKINACHAIVENEYRSAKKANESAKIPQYALKHLGDALTSNAISHLLALADENNEYALKYQSSASIGKLLYSIEQMIKPSNDNKSLNPTKTDNSDYPYILSASDIKDMYYLSSFYVYDKLNQSIKEATTKNSKTYNKQLESQSWIHKNTTKPTYSDFLSVVLSVDDVIPIEKPNMQGLHDGYCKEPYINRLQEILNAYKNQDGTDLSNIEHRVSEPLSANLMLIQTNPDDIQTLHAVKSYVKDILKAEIINHAQHISITEDKYYCLVVDKPDDIQKILRHELWALEKKRIVVIFDGVYGLEFQKIKEYIDETKFIDDSAQNNKLYFKDIIKQLVIGADAGALKSKFNWYGIGDWPMDHDLEIDADKILTIAIDYKNPIMERDLGAIDAERWLLDSIRISTKETAPYYGFSLSKLV